MKKLFTFFLLLAIGMAGVHAALNIQFESQYNPNGKFYHLRINGSYAYYGRAEGATKNYFGLQNYKPVENGALFQFVGNATGFKIYCRALNETQALGVQSATTNNSKLKVMGTSANTWVLHETSEHSYFRTQAGESMFMNNYAGNDYVSTWQDSDQGSRITVEEVTADAALQGLQTLIGTGLGQYDNQTVANQITEALAQGSTAETKWRAFDTAHSALVAATPNLPKVGQYFRIGSTLRKKTAFVQSTTESVSGSLRSILREEKGAASIFYLAADGQIVSLAEGKVFAVTNSAGNHFRVYDFQSTNYPTAYASKATRLGTYRITYNNNGTGRCLYVAAGDGHVNAGGGYGDQAGYDLALEEVTTLPIQIGATGVASFYATRALTLPQGYTAYKGTDNGTTVRLTAIEGAVPAGTAFIIKGQANTVCNITFADSNAALGNANGNALSGNGKVVTTTTPPNTYALVAEGDNAVFGPFTSNHQRAFRAYLTTTSGGVQGFSLDFDNVTNIESVSTSEADEVIYDLSGRRVQNAGSGLYIVNGKKVVR